MTDGMLHITVPLFSPPPWPQLLTFSPKHVVSNHYIIVQFISVVCSGPINNLLDHHHHPQQQRQEDIRVPKGSLSQTRRIREWHHQQVGGQGVINEQECTPLFAPSLFAPLVQTDEAAHGHTASFAHTLSRLLIFCPFPPLPHR